MNTYLVFGIGFLAQAMFFARMIAQWIKSEKAGRVVSPSIFWELSLAGALLFMVYGVLRNDLVILGGQLLSYAIYVRNMMLKRTWEKLPAGFRLFAILLPVSAILWLLVGNTYSLRYILDRNEVTGGLMILGAIGQATFTLRFVYQWMVSEQAEESLLPLGFWFLSLAGSLLIIAYAIPRRDPVLFLGQSLGTLVYLRNIALLRRTRRPG